jgi:hypothetical protein
MDSWQELIDERGDEVSVSPGRLNTWIVFGYLAGEIAGSYKPYIATDHVTLPATDRWRDFSGRVPILMDPDERIADDSPMAITLSAFERIPAIVAEQSVAERCDPLEIQRQVFG